MRERPMRDLMIAAAAALVLGAGCTGDFTDPARRFGPPVPDAAEPHPVTIHRPGTLGALDTMLRDVNGAPVGIACATCHGPTAERSIAEGDPDAPPAGVHDDVRVAHGDLACDACHAPDDRTRLRLADGRKLAFADAMDLCAQCHGVQARDYRNGSHGGMEGYWDLRRGPRTRNHCVDCHAPHAPAYGGVQPVLPPRDRYLLPAEGGHP